MHAQGRETGFQAFASDVIEVDVDPLRRLQTQVIDDGSVLVVEGDIEPAFFLQEFDLRR